MWIKSRCKHEYSYLCPSFYNMNIILDHWVVFKKCFVLGNLLITNLLLTVPEAGKFKIKALANFTMLRACFLLYREQGRRVKKFPYASYNGTNSTHKDLLEDVKHLPKVSPTL